MATVFISHSSKDDKLASQLENWMLQNGFSDLFIDHSAIRGGDKWADALRDAAGACRVVVLLVTQNWLASGECPSEFKAAWYMGKRILPLFLLPPVEKLPQASQDNLQRVMAETQGLSLLPLYEKELGLNFSKNEETSAQIKNALTAAGALKDVGLSSDVFEINRQTHELPFPGLRSFGDDDADAALFYGRSREISEAMEALRQMRASNKKKCLVVLGASGSGKSSLLKAGIIPRLRREAPAWIVLRAFRPGADPLLNFAESFTRTLADFEENIQAKGHLKQALLASWKNAERDDEGEFTPSGIASLQTQLDELANRLRDKTNRKKATLFLSVDQAEELARADDESGRAVADYLRIAMNTPETWRIAFTIRTDSFPELQNHPHFKDMEAQGYDLRSLPIFKFDDVVEKPADRYGVRVDHDLVEALMEDAPGRDALPLLAFAVQHLWDQFAGGENKKLTLKNYTDMGRLSGMIDTAAERALVGIEPDQNQMAMPKGGALKSQQEIGARSFVPMLVDINEEGAAIRRVADWSEFDADQQAMLDRFDRWRLVVKKSDDTKTTVEVAHEALFREWQSLKDWLEPEKERLETLRGVKASASAWQRKEQDAELLTHMGERLKAAKVLLGHSRYAEQLDEFDKAYIEACRRQEKKNQTRSIQLKALAGVGIAGVMAAAIAYPYQDQIITAYAKQFTYHSKSQAYLSSLKSGDSFKECAQNTACPEMVVLPSGEYLRGSENGEDDEQPVLPVSIQRFAVGKFEITHAEWEECVKYTQKDALKDQGDTHSDEDTEVQIGCEAVREEGWGREDRPVINVSWYDAQGYVAWLNTMTGNAEGTYRLLSEAEWEYAARAGTTSAYSFGSKISTSQANYDSDVGKTTPFGQYPANAFGLYDMHGNVWEWVEDWYKSGYSHAPSNGSPFTNCSNCSSRVRRGGSWDDVTWDLRSAYRSRGMPSFRDYDIGFRLARTLP